MRTWLPYVVVVLFAWFLWRINSPVPQAPEPAPVASAGVSAAPVMQAPAPPTAAPAPEEPLLPDLVKVPNAEPDFAKKLDASLAALNKAQAPRAAPLPSAAVIPPAPLPAIVPSQKFKEEEQKKSKERMQKANTVTNDEAGEP